jgi:hypothetical protein
VGAQVTLWPRVGPPGAVGGSTTAQNGRAFLKAGAASRDTASKHAATHVRAQQCLVNWHWHKHAGSNCKWLRTREHVPRLSQTESEGRQSRGATARCHCASGAAVYVRDLRQALRATCGSPAKARALRFHP